MLENFKPQFFKIESKKELLKYINDGSFDDAHKLQSFLDIHFEDSIENLIKLVDNEKCNRDEKHITKMLIAYRLNIPQDTVYNYLLDVLEEMFELIIEDVEKNRYSIANLKALFQVHNHETIYGLHTSKPK
jgi:hypothetical protein